LDPWAGLVGLVGRAGVAEKPGHLRERVDRSLPSYLSIPLGWR
jgi:hypothetical protein